MFITSVPYTPEPSRAVAFAVILPSEIAVTRPEAFIEARPVPLTIDQITAFWVAFTGYTAALN
jgi:hypothetical protein